MYRFYIIGFAMLMLFDTIGQVSFKFTAIHAQPLEASLDWIVRVFSNHWVYTAILGYVGAFFTWMTLLKKAPVGPAFAASHLEVVTVMIASIWLFNEHVTVQRLIGAGLIVAGIICLAFAEKEVLADQNQSSNNNKLKRETT